MNEPRVRQAISKAIDRQAVYDTLDGEWGWGGSITMLPPGADLPDAEFKKLLAPDIQGAKALLQAAGVTNWKPEIHHTSFSPTEVDAITVIRQNLKAVGIDATVRSAVHAVRKGGTVTLVGNITPEVTLPLQKAVTRQIRIQGSCASAGEYPQAITLLTSGAIKVSASSDEPRM